MRVLHVLGELRPSGAETMLAAAGPSFAEQGVEAEILSTGDEVGSLAPRLAASGYHIHHVPFRKSPAHFRRVSRLMSDGRYDVIHLHTERANVWFGLVAVAARPGRIVRTIHNVFAFEGALRRRRGAQRRLLQRLGVTHVACSASIQRNERERFGLTTVLVPNWYDSGRFRPSGDHERREARRALGLSAGATVVVTLGNCNEAKNHEALLEAMALLPTRDGLVYVHAGEEEPERPERALARALAIHDEVRFLGAVEDVPALLAASDVFVMPSLYEGFPIAALEALGCGLPAILADVPGLRDFRELFPPVSFVAPTAQSVADALARLLAQPRAERLTAANEVAEVARTHFGVETGVERYLRLYAGAGD